MQFPSFAISRPALALAVLLFCQFDAVAATGVSACDTQIQTDPASNITLVDYTDDRTADSASELLREPPAIESKALTLTPSVDTTVLRDDHVKSDLQLPTEESLDASPGAAALLLERRNARIRNTSEPDADVEMNTELPGMDQDEMVQFRDQMYRTDI